MKSRIDELARRVRETPFGRDVLGPKVVSPLAGWLSEHLVNNEPTDATPVGEGQVDARPDRSDSPTASDVPAATATVPGSDTPAVAAPTASDMSQVAATPAVAAVSMAAEEPASAGSTRTVTLPEPTIEAEADQSFVAAVKSLPAAIKDHNLVVVAAGIAFWGLLAIPAILFATVSIAGLVLDADTVKEEVNNNLDGLPEEAREIIGDQLEGVSSAGSGGLIAGLVVGILLALWSSSGAMAKLMAALNTIYQVKETRKFPVLRGTALGLTFGGIVFVSGAIFLLAVLPALLGSIDAVGDSLADLLVWLRFPALGLVMVIALGILYHVGPNRTGRYRPLTLGALFATVLWVLLSGLFSVYTSTVGSYNETYGSIGGIVILLLWLFITAFVVLLGGAIYAHMNSTTD